MPFMGQSTPVFIIIHREMADHKLNRHKSFEISYILGR